VKAAAADAAAKAAAEATAKAVPEAIDQALAGFSDEVKAAAADAAAKAAASAVDQKLSQAAGPAWKRAVKWSLTLVAGCVLSAVLGYYVPAHDTSSSTPRTHPTVRPTPAASARSLRS
jgi:hypothetical protein